MTKREVRRQHRRCLVSYDDAGRITDFGSVEVQGVYISGNLTKPFKHFMENPDSRRNMDWTGQKKLSPPGLSFLVEETPRAADDLQGRHPEGVGKKAGCRRSHEFYATLPALKPVDAGNESKRTLRGQLYRLQHDAAEDRYKLAL